MQPVADYDIAVVTPPEDMPVTLAEAKQHLRVLHGSEDDLIGRLIAVATAHVEHRLSRSLFTRTLRLSLDAFPARGEPVILRRSPVAAVVAVKYHPVSGAEITLGAHDYQLATHPLGAALYPAAGVTSWPSVASRRRAVTIDYTAGYGEVEDVPQDIGHAILLLVEHLYQNRSAVADAQKITVPFAVDALLGPHMTTGWI